ncbi:hypothetical protein D3C81_2271420 [compost metagenome]
MAGWPVMSWAAVLPSISNARETFSVIEQSAAGSGWAVIGTVGITNRSKRSSALS